MSLFGMVRPTRAVPPPSNPVEAGLRIIGAQVQGAFLSQDIPADLELRIQGPRTVTVVLAPLRFNLADAGRLRKMEPVIEHYLRMAPVRVSYDAGLVYVEVPSPWPVPLLGIGRGFRGSGLTVGLGLTSRNEVATLDMGRNPHVLLVGPTNAGKSTAARAIVYHLIDQSLPVGRDLGIRVAVLSRRPGDWAGLVKPTPAAGVLGLVHHDEAEAALSWLRETVQVREKRGQVEPHIFFVVDDLLALLAEAKVAETLSVIASQGRAAGVHLILCTQRLGQKGAGDAVVTGNIRARLVFGTADAQDAAAFTGRGDTGAEKLMESGDCLMVTPVGVTRVTVANVEPGDLGVLPRWSAPLAPWDRRLFTTAQPLPPPPLERGENRPPVVENTPPSPVVGVATELQPPATVAGYRRLPPQDPTPEDAAYIRQVYAELGSKTQTCIALWGKKWGDMERGPWRWLHVALGEGGA